MHKNTEHDLKRPKLEKQARITFPTVEKFFIPLLCVYVQNSQNTFFK